MQVFQEDDAPPGPDRQDQSLIRPDDQGLRAGAEDRLAFRILGLLMTAKVFLDQRPVPRDSSEKPRSRRGAARRSASSTVPASHLS